MYDQPLTQDPDQNEIQQEQIRRGVFRAQTKKFRWTRLWGGKLVLIEDFYCFLLISDHCWCCISQWFLGTHGKWKLCWIMLASGNYAKLCYMMLARLQSVNYAFYAKASVAQPNWHGLMPMAYSGDEAYSYNYNLTALQLPHAAQCRPSPSQRSRLRFVFLWHPPFFAGWRLLVAVPVYAGLTLICSIVTFAIMTEICTVL